MVDLGHYGCKGYTSVVLGYSEVTLLGEREDATLCPSVYCGLVIYSIVVSKQYVIEFLCISSRTAAFLFLIFLSTMLSSCINCPRVKKPMQEIRVQISQCSHKHTSVTYF